MEEEGERENDKRKRGGGRGMYRLIGIDTIQTHNTCRVRERKGTWFQVGEREREYSTKVKHRIYGGRRERERDFNM